MAQLSEARLDESPDPDPEPAEVAERREAAARVLRLLESLPPGQREVIRLKFQNGFSYQEISRISGKTVNNVGVLIHTGLKTLRGKLLDGRAAGAQS